ncbi:hypothetical protein Pfo_022411 [Paulownia fortunei]|nr:hypothetical protein Pfo_022411 [Paulownia fortunei]
MDDYECHQTFNFELVKSEFTTRDKPPSSSPQLDINFKFFSKIKLSQWVLHQDSTEPQFVGQLDPPLIENFVGVSLQQFLCHEETREAINQEVRHLPLEYDGRQKLIEYAWEKTWEIVKSKPTGHNVLHLHFHVLVEHHHVFDQSSDAMIQQSFQESESCMIPTADSSIQSLKTKVMDSGNIETCSICLEDFSHDDGCEALCMPCSHIFHSNCIKKWLTTSHYCPLCRFEMPTS